MSYGRTRAIVALAVAVLAVAAVIWQTSGSSTYTLHAVFSDVNGLVDTGYVEVAGFKVGTITGISVRIGHDPEVTMEVSDGFRVRHGAHAVIELGSLAGQLNRYVELTPGAGSELRSGATIPIGDTDEPVEIDQFLSVLTPKLRTQLRTLLRETVSTLDGRSDDIAQSLRYSVQAFRQTAAMFGDVGADGVALRTLVGRAADGAAQLAAEPADVAGTVQRLSVLLNTAAARQSALARTLALAPPAFASTRTTLSTLNGAIPTFTALVNRATPALDAVAPLAHSLEVTAPRAVPLFHAALDLVAAFRDSSPEITRLLAPPLPSTLHNLEVGLVGAGPVLDQLRARAPDVLGWIPLLGDASANYGATGHGVLVIPSIKPAPQQPITPPSCGPGWLLRPFDRLPGELGCDAWTSYVTSFVEGGKPDTSYLTPAQQAPWPGEFPK